MTTVESQFNGRVVAGRYQLGPRRGSGVDAAVFEAFDLVERRIVVIKVVHPDLSATPEFERDFRAAVEAAAALKHPNLAAIYDWGVDQWAGRSAPFVVVEHLGGGSLRDVLDRGRLLSPSQALSVGLDACRALDLAHRNGLVHGDIRPSTLMFGVDHVLRVTDLGVANVVGTELWRDSAHVSNSLAMYASPELAASGTRSPKGDVYSLCLTLLEALNGTVPFAGDSTVATLGNRIGKLMPVSADLGPLAAVLERAGRPDPGDRSTASEFGRALVQAAEKLPRPAPISLPGTGLFDRSDPSQPAARPILPPPVRVAEPASTSTPTATLPAVEQAPAMPTPSAAPAAAGPGQPEPQRPRRSKRWMLWAAAVLIVLGGIGAGAAYVLTRTVSHVVPDLVGVEQGVALNEIAGSQWQVQVSEAPDEVVASGTVIRSDPPAGTKLAEGRPLELVVSTGPAPRILDELVGLTLADASAKLQAAGLTVEQGDDVFDESVAPGTVVSWSVPEQPALKAGDTVTKGTTVRVVVSKGPAPRAVPNVVALTLPDATAQLQALGLQIAQLPDENSETVPAGAVARQDPPADTPVDRGAVVSVALSAGPAPVALPAVAGLGAQAATDALTAGGFTVGTITGPAEGLVASVRVAGADVAAGTVLPRGTVVELVMY